MATSHEAAWSTPTYSQPEASDVFFAYLYSAGVQEGLVVVVESIFCIGLGSEANKRELPGLPFFGADDLCIRHLSRRPESTMGIERHVSLMR